MTLASLVVLGCRVGPAGALGAPAARRVQRAARAFAEGVAPTILICGGKRWYGMHEADAFATALAQAGVPGDRIEHERRSQTTLENALRAAELMLPARRRIGLVTCDFHMPRALECFRRVGFDPEPLHAPAPALPPLATRARAMREWLASWLDALRSSRLTRV